MGLNYVVLILLQGVWSQLEDHNLEPLNTSLLAAAFGNMTFQNNCINQLKVNSSWTSTRYMRSIQKDLESCLINDYMARKKRSFSKNKDVTNNDNETDFGEKNDNFHGYINEHIKRKYYFQNATQNFDLYNNLDKEGYKIKDCAYIARARDTVKKVPSNCYWHDTYYDHEYEFWNFWHESGPDLMYTFDFVLQSHKFKNEGPFHFWFLIAYLKYIARNIDNPETIVNCAKTTDELTHLIYGLQEDVALSLGEAKKAAEKVVSVVAQKALKQKILENTAHNSHIASAVINPAPAGSETTRQWKPPSPTSSPMSSEGSESSTRREGGGGGGSGGRPPPSPPPPDTSSDEYTDFGPILPSP